MQEMRKFISGFLALCMVISMLPMTAKAEEHTVEESRNVADESEVLIIPSTDSTAPILESAKTGETTVASDNTSPEIENDIPVEAVETVPVQEDIPSTEENTASTEPNAIEIIIENPSATLHSSAANDFTYEVLDDDYCQITRYTGNEKSITIPSEIDQYTVLCIADYAFYNRTDLQSIILQSSRSRLLQDRH